MTGLKSALSLFQVTFAATESDSVQPESRADVRCGPTLLNNSSSMFFYGGGGVGGEGGGVNW